MKYLLKLPIFVIGLIFVFSGCEEALQEKPGSAPSASASIQQGSSAPVGTTITLDGSNSSDPDGDTLNYQWTVISAPSNASTQITSDANKAKANYNVQVVGDYEFQLSVNDGIHDPVTTTVSFTATESVGNPPNAVVPNDMSGTVEQEVEFDGSGSSDPDGQTLTYNWTITGSPTGSSANISDSTKAIASITPDKEGDYVIELLVQDPDGNTDKASFTLTVSGPQTVILDSDINANDTLKNIFEEEKTKADYRVTSNININAELVVNPGVKIELEEDRFITVTAEGILKSIGTETDSIIFTSANVSGGLKWGGIIIESGNIQNEIKYTKVLHAGNSRVFYKNGSNRYANIGIQDNGKLNISHSLIGESTDEGIYASGDNFESFASNTFINNGGYALSIPFNQAGMIDANTDVTKNGGDNYVRIYGSTMTDDQKMNAFNGSFLVSGHIDLASNLTLNAGVKMEFDQNELFTVTADGVLISKGTANDNVVLTSSNISGGIHWGGLIIESGNINNELDYTEVSHAGSDGQRLFYVNGANRYGNIGITSNGTLTLTNSIISNSNSEGIYSVDNSFESFSNNEFNNNGSYGLSIHFDDIGKMDGNTTFSGNGNNVVRVYGSSIINNQTVTKLAGDAAYNFTGSVSVKADLEIDPGTKFTLDEEVQFTVTTDGSIQAVGTSTENIVFTSSNTAGNVLWAGILINSNNSLNKFQYVEISYGGNNSNRLGYWDGSNRYGNLGVDGGQIEVIDCSLNNSGGNGIIVSSTGQVNGYTSADTNAASEVESVNSFSGNNSANVLFTSY